jgi:sec-independent protein translocase protein TatB
MFEMGFWELVLVGVVALVVIGPERLPKMARIAGLWIGRARRTLSSVQAEINRELKAEELKVIMEKQAHSRPLETIIEELSQPLERTPASPSNVGTPAAGAGDPIKDAAPGALGSTRRDETST